MWKLKWNKMENKLVKGLVIVSLLGLTFVTSFFLGKASSKAENSNSKEKVWYKED